MDIVPIPVFFLFNREKEQKTQKEERLMEEKKRKKQEEKKKKEGAPKKVWRSCYLIDSLCVSFASSWPLHHRASRCSF